MEDLIDSTKEGASLSEAENKPPGTFGETEEAGYSSHWVCRLSVAAVTGQRRYKIVTVP